MKTNNKIRAYILRGSTAALLLSCVIVALCSAINLPEQPHKGLPPQDNAAFGANAHQSQTLSFAERVAYQTAIEDVYWRHRIWPDTNSDPKPPLNKVMSQAQIEKKVADYLRNSQALQDYWHRPITADQLQAEIERMASNTKKPEVLQELFEAIGSDPFVIAECLARPILAERLLTERLGGSSAPSLDDKSNREAIKNSRPSALATIVRGVADPPDEPYTLPVIASPSGGCIDNTWAPTTLTNAPSARRDHTAVWTGSEMIIWSGYYGPPSTYYNNGGRYNPTTDSWTATSTTNAPAGRFGATAVWTGTEMIVWGGVDGNLQTLNTGGRYDPSTETWTPTSLTNAPEARYAHTAVWTGKKMIVWGGCGDFGCFQILFSGGAYNPGTDSWTATSTTNAPTARFAHTAVLAGSEMIVWGGWNGTTLNTGGTYNPSIDNWTSTSTTNAPTARFGHTAVWSGSEMIVWGGASCFTGGCSFDTGGRYSPSTKRGTATRTTP